MPGNFKKCQKREVRLGTGSQDSPLTDDDDDDVCVCVWGGVQ